MKLPLSTFRAAVSAIVALWLAPTVVHAVPSFARQMNLQCTACHTEYPILNDFGRQFKLSGYTLSTGKSSIPPISAMVSPSFTATQEGQPGGAAPGFRDNNNTALTQASIFYAGRLFGDLAGEDPKAFANKFGVFLQTTYDGIGKTWAWDNAEIRYADSGTIAGKDAAFGFYVNNNPTLQDPWNTIPAWGYPFTGSGLAPTPAAATLIDGGVSQQVAGFGAYTMIDDTLYLDLGAYHTLGTKFQRNLGINPVGETEITNLAPYWRVAVQKSPGKGTLEVGTFGMAADTFPGRDHSAGTDHIYDFGVDSQYQISLGHHEITTMLSYIYEHQDLSASQQLGNSLNQSNDLNNLKATVDYLYDGTYGGAIQYFIVDGKHDPLLYSGSSKGSPLSDGLILQANYMPFNKGGGSDFWPKSSVKLSLQYVIYNRFDGSRSNYDGSGRNARDNNTLYLEAWILF